MKVGVSGVAVVEVSLFPSGDLRAQAGLTGPGPPQPHTGARNVMGGPRKTSRRDLDLRSTGAPARVAILSAEEAVTLHSRLVARDERALVDLIELATPWVLGIAQAILRDADEAEEVAQGSFA